MVDLTEYARSLESDLTFIRGWLEKLESGAVQAGMRANGKEWVDFTRQSILLYKRMIFTYDAALMGVKTKLGQSEGTGS